MWSTRLQVKRLNMSRQYNQHTSTTSSARSGLVPVCAITIICPSHTGGRLDTDIRMVLKIQLNRAHIWERSTRAYCHEKYEDRTIHVTQRIGTVIASHIWSLANNGHRNKHLEHTIFRLLKCTAEPARLISLNYTTKLRATKTSRDVY